MQISCLLGQVFVTIVQVGGLELLWLSTDALPQLVTLFGMRILLLIAP